MITPWLYYDYFKKYYKTIETDLSIQQTLDADPKVIQEKEQARRTINNIFHYWRSQRNSFRFFTSNCKRILILFFALI